jgi:hypothetical protein
MEAASSVTKTVKGATGVASGNGRHIWPQLGFMEEAIVDQHFCEDERCTWKPRYHAEMCLHDYKGKWNAHLIDNPCFMIHNLK